MKRIVKTIHFPLLPSTNDWAKEHIEEFDRGELTMIIADEQSAGRGQFERKWTSPKGGLYVSYVYFLDRYPTNTGEIGQMAFGSVNNVIQGLGIKAEKRGVNDVMIGDKKVAGILCETVQVEDGIGVVVGIGVNVHVDEVILREVGQPATSLHLHVDKGLVSVRGLAESIAEELMKGLV